MISLTDEQKAAVRVSTHLHLTACPGSGKTRVILAKLLGLADKYWASPRKISCITYTNAAVDEIEGRLRKYGGTTTTDKCDVSTIHSFCLRNILKPYSWLIPEIPLNFKILTRETSDFARIVLAVENEIGRMPSRYVLEDYDGLRIDLNGNPAGQGFTSGSVTEASAKLYWARCLANGFLDYSMIIYYSWRILSEFPYVGVGAGSRYSCFLVDEFQDTSDIQIEIFRLLNNVGNSTFFFVGDENQSILGFAGARPDLGRALVSEMRAQTDKKLSANFRSGPAIVNLAEKLIQTDPPMRSVEKALNFTAAPVYVKSHSMIDAITDEFLPMILEDGIPYGNAAILAPRWTDLLPIARGLRERDIPVFGPGARPYKKSRLFATLAERLGACAISEDLKGLPGVERALFQLIRQSEGTTRFDIFSYKGRRAALSLVYSANDCFSRFPSGVEWLRECCLLVCDILSNDEWIGIDVKDALLASVEQMIDDMRKRGVDLDNLQVADLGLFANPDNAIKLISLHNSKGREFDAVAMICMNEGRIPFFTAKTEEEFAEARRLFYVGLTRAKRRLLVVSDTSDYRNPPTRYVAEAGLT